MGNSRNHISQIFLQTLWACKCDWDDPILSELLHQWRLYHAQLSTLEDVIIPRWTRLGSDVIHHEIHGLSDASTKAYAAAIYLQVTSLDGSVTVTLLIAKSKVAPVKTVSVPRLELSAALLLARLVRFVKTSLHFERMPSSMLDRLDHHAGMAESASQSLEDLYSKQSRRNTDFASRFVMVSRAYKGQSH